MLLKKYKLDTDFFKNNENKRNSKILSSNLFTLKKYKSDKLFSRFSVVVSTKISKKATERNKIKRIVYKFIKEKNIYITPGNDFVFIAKKEIEKKIKKEIIQDLIKLLAI